MTNPYILRVAKSRWSRRRAALLREGRWQPFVPAAPIREHVQSIRATGMSLPRLAERSGVGVGTLNYLLYGEPGYPVPEQIRTESADRLQAFWPALDDYADGAAIDSTGTIRRLEALGCAGWLPIEVARHTGVAHDTARQIPLRARVTAATARSVRDLYKKAADRPAEEFGIAHRSAARARRRAADRGFAPAIAWDDDTIDDPAAQPNFGEKVPAYVAHVENLRELERQGYTREQIADRLGVTRDTLQRSLTFYRERFGSAA